MEGTTVQTFSEVYAGKSIVEIIVDSIKGLTTGVTGSISESFNALVLNENGQLSALAIWALSVFGLSVVWIGLKYAVGFFRSFTAKRSEG